MNLSIDKVKDVKKTNQPSAQKRVSEAKPVVFNFNSAPLADSIVTKKLWSDETKGIVLTTTSNLGIQNWKPTILKTNHDAIKASQTHLIDLMRYYEGDANYYYEAYTNSYNDNYNNATNGFGKLSKHATTQEDAYKDLCKELEARAKEIKNNLKDTYDKLPASIKEALIDLNYNKGLPKITENKKLMNALQKGNYADAIAEMKYVYSGRSDAKKSKSDEDPGLYRRSLSRMILATRDLEGNELDKAKKEIEKIYIEGLDCFQRKNKSCAEFTKIYEQFTTGNISGKATSAESFKYKVDKSIKSIWSLGQALKKELNITDKKEYEDFYNKILKINNITPDGKNFKAEMEITVPYIDIMRKEAATQDTIPTQDTIAAQKITEIKPDTIIETKQDTIAVEKQDTIQNIKEQATPEKTKTEKPGFFTWIWNGLKAIGNWFLNLFGLNKKEENTENLNTFQKMLKDSSTQITEEGDFQIITSEHTVEKGDGIWRLAKTYHLDEKEFCEENGITDRDKIKIGQKLTLKKLGYKIKDNETIKDIADKLGLDEILLKDLNNIEDDNQVKAGTIIEIPGFIYKVKQGDTLYKISKQVGVSIGDLKKINGLTNDNIYPNQQIKIIYNNVDYAIPESSKKTTIDKETNTVTEVIDMSTIDPDLKSRKHLKKNKRNGKIVATREVFEPTGNGALNGKTIIVNAGHGYKVSGIEDRGTLGSKYNFPDEWLLNYDNSMRLIEKLQAQGAKVIYLQGNEDKKSQGRALISNALEEKQNKADMFISVHVNSSDKYEQDDRMEIFHHPKSSTGNILATIVDKNMEEYIHSKNKGYNVQTKTGDKQVLRTFGEVTNNSAPAILWETAFMNSKEGRKRLANADLMDRYADIMCNSVIKYFEEEAKITIHKVKAGDTISEIAKKYNVSAKELKKANNLTNDNIRVGQSLRIPN